MMFSSVNIIAVLVAAIVWMIIGSLWYSPLLFGKRWMALSGFSEKDKAAMKSKANIGYVGMLITSVITNVVLAVVLGFAGVSGFVDGLLIGAVVWIGFIATTQIGGVLWDNKPIELFLINTSYSLLTFAISGGILAVWM